mmetsp:Transcript_10574/g.9322  ORF Transcript_10574/g.9322 Transcript_10574/m.9322 type:complete len:272 (+) Transcript_10574:950-1765(+)
MSDSVPIATEYLDEGESIQEFMKFDTDSAGQVLRYKVLIQNHKILTVLYNSGASIEEIPFKETKLCLDNPLVQARITDSVEEPTSWIMKLNKLPQSMTCAHDKKLLENMSQETVENEPYTHCRMRYFERLPGYIDVEMISDDNCMSLYKGEYKFSIPVCLCEQLDEYQKTLILSMEEHEKEQSLKGAKEAIQSLDKFVEEYKFAKFKNLEEMQKAFTKLKTAEENINQLLGEDKVQDEEIVEQAKKVFMMSSKVLRGMAAEMRMLALKNKA